MEINGNISDIVIERFFPEYNKLLKELNLDNFDLFFTGDNYYIHYPVFYIKPSSKIGIELTYKNETLGGNSNKKGPWFIHKTRESILDAFASGSIYKEWRKHFQELEDALRSYMDPKNGLWVRALREYDRLVKIESSSKIIKTLDERLIRIEQLLSKFDDKLNICLFYIDRQQPIKSADVLNLDNDKGLD